MLLLGVPRGGSLRTTHLMHLYDGSSVDGRLAIFINLDKEKMKFQGILDTSKEYSTQISHDLYEI